MVEQVNLEKEISEISDPKALRVITYLLQRIQVLEEKIARLEKNSTNSSKPPSSDITKPDHEQRKPGERKIGGQAHHPGKSRNLIPPEKVDRREPVAALDKCPECGEALVLPQEPKELVDQTIELKAKPLEAIEYHRPGRWCNKCNMMHYPPLPEGVLEGQLCGPRLQALIAYMKGNLGASYTELSQFFSEALGLEISRGALCDIIKRTSSALEIPCQELQTQIPKQTRLNIDESGWYDCGKRYWVWLFCTESVALFSIQRSRGCKVLEEILGQTFQGAIISDFYSAYVKYANAVQQFCLAHLIRDIKFLTILPDPLTQNFGKDVLRCFQLIFEHWHHRDKVTQQVFLKRSEKTQRRLFMLLTKALLPKGEALTMKKRLLKHWDSLFRFIHMPTLLQPTNNLAEQTMRFVVRIRRQTQGTRSEWGRIWCGRIMSVIATCRKQARSSWSFLLQAIKAKNFGSNFPSLLPT